MTPWAIMEQEKFQARVLDLDRQEVEPGRSEDSEPGAGSLSGEEEGADPCGRLRASTIR